MFWKETFWKGLVTLGGYIIILLTLTIGFFLVYRGMGTFTTYGHSIKEFLFSTEWKPVDYFDGGGQVGAAIYIVGSITTCGLALCIATPFSLAAAIFMTEITPKLGKVVFQPVVEIFVGIPSVVYGYLGLTILCPAIKAIFPETFGGFSVLAAGLVLAIMIFPTITTITADAIRGVNKGYREASYGLGATRWQTIYKVILPSAKGGIYTGIILGLARAFGEALAVAMVIGRFRALPKNMLSPTHNLTAAIAADMSGSADGGELNIALWTMALLLFLISLFFIFLVHYIAGRGEKVNG